MNKGRFDTIEAPLGNDKEPNKEKKPMEIPRATKERIIGILNNALDTREEVADSESEMVVHRDLQEIAEHANTVLKEVLNIEKLKSDASLEKVLLVYRNLFTRLPHPKKWAPSEDDEELLKFLIKRFGLPEDQNR